MFGHRFESGHLHLIPPLAGFFFTVPDPHYPRFRPAFDPAIPGLFLLTKQISAVIDALGLIYNVNAYLYFWIAETGKNGCVQQ